MFSVTVYNTPINLEKYQYLIKKAGEKPAVAPAVAAATATTTTAAEVE